TLGGLKDLNYNAIKTLQSLVLTAASLTVFAGTFNELYMIPGLLALLAILNYRIWDLGSKAFNPLNIIEIWKINVAMRYGYSWGWVREAIR
ncbi:MAG: hypothetical protein ABEJ98_01830, partial [Candidatus Nanohaloarchaea archaeon]